MIGVQEFRPDDRTLDDFTGVTFLTAVSWSLWNRTGFEVQSGRNITYSYRDEEPFYLLTNGRLSMSHRIYGPLEVVGSAERQFLSYRFQRSIPDVLSLPDEATRNIFSAGVGVTLYRSLKVTVSGERTLRHSDIDSENFSRTRLLTSVTFGS